jgi:hypothetical protein
MTVKAGVWLPIEVLDRVNEKQKNIAFYYPKSGDQPNGDISFNKQLTGFRPSYFMVLGEPK